MINNSNVIDGRSKTSLVGIPCATNFLREFILRIGDFFSVLQKLIFKTRTHCLFVAEN